MDGMMFHKLIVKMAAFLCNIQRADDFIYIIS